MSHPKTQAKIDAILAMASDEQQSSEVLHKAYSALGKVLKSQFAPSGFSERDKIWNVVESDSVITVTFGDRIEYRCQIALENLRNILEGVRLHKKFDKKFDRLETADADETALIHKELDKISVKIQNLKCNRFYFDHA